MKKQTAGRDNLGKLAPKFAELNDDVLFGEVWSREDKLSLRDRSVATISALMAQGLFPQLKSHIAIRQRTWNNKRGNGRNSYTTCILYRMAKGLEYISFDK
jgi:hypothetical protein